MKVAVITIIRPTVDCMLHLNAIISPNTRPLQMKWAVSFVLVILCTDNDDNHSHHAQMQEEVERKSCLVTYNAGGSCRERVAYLYWR